MTLGLECTAFQMNLSMSEVPPDVWPVDSGPTESKRDITKCPREEDPGVVLSEMIIREKQWMILHHCPFSIRVQRSFEVVHPGIVNQYGESKLSKAVQVLSKPPFGLGHDLQTPALRCEHHLPCVPDLQTSEYRPNVAFGIL